MVELRPWLKPLAGLVVCALTVQGCYLLAKHYQAPLEPLHPTIVGVVAEVTVVGDGWRIRLKDGRTVEEPHQTDFTLLGAVPSPGDLLPSSTLQSRLRR